MSSESQRRRRKKAGLKKDSDNDRSFQNLDKIYKFKKMSKPQRE